MARARLVTILGGAGFVGSHAAEAFVAARWRVRLAGRARRGWGAVAHLGAEVERQAVDVGDTAAVRGALVGADVMVYAVGTSVPAASNVDPAADALAHLVPFVRALDAARAEGVRRVVFASSGGTVYGPAERLPIDESHPTNPTCAYGIVKLASEKYLGLARALHGLETVALRFSNLYGARQDAGSGQGAVAAFLARIRAGGSVVVWGDGRVVRDYLHVADAARAIVLGAERAPPGAVLNIGSGVGTSLNELVAALQRVTGLTVRVEKQAARPFDVPANVLEIAAASAQMGWRPGHDLEAGLARTCQAL